MLSRTRAASSTNLGWLSVFTSRGRGRSTAMTALSRPGRALITTTVSESRTASVMLWVTNSTVLRVALQNLLQLEAHALARDDVERAEGLVHQQEGGVEEKRPADRHPLLHAARELVGVALLEALEAGKPDELARARAIAIGRLAAHLRGEEHVRECGAPGQEHRGLEDHADAHERPAHLLAAHLYASLRGCDQARNHAQQGRLAAAAWADEGDELLVADLEGELLDRGTGPEGLREPIDPDGGLFV